MALDFIVTGNQLSIRAERSASFFELDRTDDVEILVNELLTVVLHVIALAIDPIRHDNLRVLPAQKAAKWSRVFDAH